jgi:hypothetical protein
MKTFLDFFTEAAKASKSDVDYIINNAFDKIDKAISDNAVQKPIVLWFIGRLRTAIKEEAFVSDYKKQISNTLDALGLRKKTSEVSADVDKLKELFQLTDIEPTQPEQAPQPVISPDELKKSKEKIEQLVKFAAENKEDPSKKLQIRKAFNGLKKELSNNKFFESEEHKSELAEFTKCADAIISYKTKSQLIDALNSLIVLFNLNIDEVTEKAAEPIISQENIVKSLDEIEKAITFADENKDNVNERSKIKSRFYALRNELTADNFFKSEYYKSTQQTFGKIVDLISQYKDTKELISLLNRINDLFDLQMQEIVDSELSEPTTDVENPDKLFTTISNKIREKLKPAKQETLAEKIKWLFIASPNNSRY